MQKRRFMIEQVPQHTLFEVTYVEKFYIKKDYNIYYFTRTVRTRKDPEKVIYGLEIPTEWRDTGILLNKETFEILTRDCLAKLRKTIYLMQLEDNSLLPITIVEIQEYHDLNVILVEIDFETKKLAELFIPPIWFGEELINDYFNDFVIAFGKNEHQEFIDECDPVTNDIMIECKNAEVYRSQKIGSFEERLQRIKNRPTKI